MENLTLVDLSEVMELQELILPLHVTDNEAVCVFVCVSVN